MKNKIKRQGLVTSIKELKEIIKKLKEEDKELEKNLGFKLGNDGFSKVQLNIINKEGLSDTWRFEK